MKGRSEGYFLAEALNVFSRGFGIEDVDDNDLRGGHTRRQHQTLIVAVHHDHHTDGACGEAPAVLPDKLALYASTMRPAPTARLCLVGDVEHLREVLAQAVRCGGLNRTAVGGDEGLNGCRVETAGKLLLLGLAALDDRHGQHLFVHAGIVVKDLQHFLLGLFLRGECTVAFLHIILSCGKVLARGTRGCG